MVQSWFQKLFWNQDCDVVSNLVVEIAIYNFDLFHSALVHNALLAKPVYLWPGCAYVQWSYYLLLMFAIMLMLTMTSKYLVAKYSQLVLTYFILTFYKKEMTFGFPPKKLDDVGVCFPVPGDHSENSSYYILGRTHPIILLACPTIIFP